MLGDKHSLTVNNYNGNITCICSDTEKGAFSNLIDKILIATDKQILGEKYHFIPQSNSEINDLFDSNIEFKISESLKWYDSDEDMDEMMSYLKEKKFVLYRNIEGLARPVSLIIHISIFDLENTEYDCISNEITDSPIDILGCINFIVKKQYIFDDMKSWIQAEFLSTRFGFYSLMSEYETTKKYITQVINSKMMDMRFVDWLIKVDTKVNSTFLANYIETSLMITTLSEKKLKETCDKMIEKEDFSFFEWLLKPMPLAENKDAIEYFQTVRKEIQGKYENGFDNDNIESETDGK